MSAKTADSSLGSYFRGRSERPSGPEDDFSLSDCKAFVTLTSFMKFSGAVLIRRVNGSRSGAWGSWMKEALSSSTLISTLPRFISDGHAQRHIRHLFDIYLNFKCGD